jgi:AcrR family transcriptional regulator
MSAAETSTHRTAARTRKPRGQGHERPEEILAAAKEMFVTEGFEAVTTRKLAARVGLSQTGLYVYFKSKEDILDALCQRTYAATLERYRQIDAEFPDDLDRFKAMVRWTVDSGLAAPDEYQIIYMTRRRLLHGAEESKKPPEERSRGAQVVSWQMALVGRLIERGVFRPMSRTVAGQLAITLPHGLVARLVAWPDFPWADRSKLADALVETLTRGLLAAPA